MKILWNKLYNIFQFFKYQIKNNIDKEKFRHVFRNSEQKLNDQKLEFFTYDSTWKLGSLKGTSRDVEKVYHGEGPMIINFKDTPSLVRKLQNYFS